MLYLHVIFLQSSAFHCGDLLNQYSSSSDSIAGFIDGKKIRSCQKIRIFNPGYANPNLKGNLSHNLIHCVNYQTLSTPSSPLLILFGSNKSHLIILNYWGGLAGKTFCLILFELMKDCSTFLAAVLTCCVFGWLDHLSQDSLLLPILRSTRIRALLLF